MTITISNITDIDLIELYNKFNPEDRLIVETDPEPEVKGILYSWFLLHNGIEADSHIKITIS